MASRVTHDIALPADAVWAVAADPRLYAGWVVGASAIRAVDGPWPAVGATLHHTQGGLLRDTTEVLESRAPVHLKLLARVRPLLVTEVDLHLAPADGGTRVVFDERVVRGGLGVLPDALLDRAMDVRNRLALRRMEALARIGAQLGLAG